MALVTFLLAGFRLCQIHVLQKPVFGAWPVAVAVIGAAEPLCGCQQSPSGCRYIDKASVAHSAMHT